MPTNLRPTTNVTMAGAPTNPAQMYDEDLGTFGQCFADAIATPTIETTELRIWSATDTYIGKVKTLWYKYTASVQSADIGGPGTPSAGASIRYYDGTSWNTVSSLSVNGTNSDTIALDTYEYILPVALDMTLFKVEIKSNASATSSDTADSDSKVYEIWVEVFKSYGHGQAVFL